MTIYHGDARELLPLMPQVDLVLTDPPYGIDAARHRKSQAWGWRDYGSPDERAWDLQAAPQELIEQCIAAGRSAVVWGGNYFSLPPSMGWFIWDKGQRDFSLADCEMAWTSENRAARIYFLARSQALQEGREHPTQKPIALMRWCLEKFPDAQTILDPFAGSGTTGRAAKDLGRKAILIEIEERYCAIAAERMRQLVLV